MCPYIFFECKNYSSDPRNPEFDQLNGRLSDRRGKFGILVCRKVTDRDWALATCKDFLHNQNSYMLVLDDDDICRMLAMKEAHRDRDVFEYPSDQLRPILM